MGIKAEDLRVGNLLFWGDAVVKVVLIKADGWLAVEYGEDKRFIHVDFCKPTPLTEEWLNEKFNFDKNKSKMEWVKDGIRICFTTENRFVYPDSAHGWVYVDYVHDLQNLFKELKKTELTLK